MMAGEFNAWIGGQECSYDIAAPSPAQRLAATLDLDAPYGQGSILPPLWHWLYFLPSASTGDLGLDGHPAKGGFLPSIDLPRRMWAGSQIEFRRPIRIGDAIERRSTITDIRPKEGRSGTLLFVTVRHDISAAGEWAISEQQSIVYRSPPPAGAAPLAGVQPKLAASWRKRVVPSAALLFRYSALTFNSHRIHYDLPYAREEEGYQALVVHGPLLATLMLEHLRAVLPDLRVSHFTFRAVKPVFADAPFELCATIEGDIVYLWVEDLNGLIATSGEARVSHPHKKE